MTATVNPLSQPAVLQARGLHRFYRRGDEEVSALRDVTLTALPGEMIAVVGPSGSGKSTLLNLLAGLDDPDGGNVWIDGQRFSHRLPADQARMRGQLVGVLTQGAGLIDHLSVLGNVRLAKSFRSRRGRRTPAGGEKVNSLSTLLAALGIAELSQARPATLSGGETARAGLAVALVGDPLVLLADEPTAEVSKDEEASILGLLRRVRPAHGATVVVTHSESVAAAADRVLHMRDGRLT